MPKGLLALLLAGLWGHATVAQAVESSAPRFDIARFDVRGNTLLKADAVAALLAPFTGKQRDFRDVQLALEALQDAYREAGYGTVLVILPEQEVDRGTIVLKIAEAKVRQVTVEGNRHFDEANIRRSLPALKEGEAPNTRALAANLRLANENPAKETTLQFRGTDSDDAVDAVVKVADDKPWKLGATLDNTGTQATGISRLGLSFQHFNLGNRDQSLAFQYITSPEKPSQVNVFGLGFHAPLYAADASVDVFGGHSDVDSGVVENLFAVSGKGTVLGLRYNQNLVKHGDYEQRLVLGLDYRAYQNAAVPLGGTTSLIPDVTVHPLSLGYSGQWTTVQGTTGFYLTLVRNIPGGSMGRNEHFNLSRAGADADYALARFGASVGRVLPADWQARLALNGQYTDDALVSGEQFGLGGATSVRGFNEREIANDVGYQGNLELYTPDIASKLGWGESQARLLAFYDFGHVYRNKALAGETASATVASIGAGLRYSYRKNFGLRLDVASVVDAGGSQKVGDTMIHLNLGYLY